MHVCKQLYVLIYISYFITIMLILANAEGIGKCGHACAQEYICVCVYVCVHMHMFISMCMSLDVCLYCIRYSHYNMPTDSAAGTHLSINLSTMMHIEATNYAGALCIVPDRNTHAILLMTSN